MSEKALDPIRKLPLIETRPEHFLSVIRDGTVSTNIFLRRLHSFAVGMKWLPWPVLTARQWPRVRDRFDLLLPVAAGPEGVGQPRTERGITRSA